MSVASKPLKTSKKQKKHKNTEKPKNQQIL
jgi:hypothetical protein